MQNEKEHVVALLDVADWSHDFNLMLLEVHRLEPKGGFKLLFQTNRLVAPGCDYPLIRIAIKAHDTPENLLLDQPEFGTVDYPTYKEAPDEQVVTLFDLRDGDLIPDETGWKPSDLTGYISIQLMTGECLFKTLIDIPVVLASSVGHHWYYPFFKILFRGQRSQA